ncbi:MAG TPA: porin [Acidobacteriota bacterium]|nr:porin [Acidobacteriota bacterium]
MNKQTLVVLAATLLALLLSGAALAETAGVQVGTGTLKLGGILQAGYTYHMEDLEGEDEFSLNRARFLLWGEILPGKVKYFVQTETKGAPAILDYKAQLFYIRNTEVTVGRFLPNFTLYMPYSTAKLEMINYPLTTQKFAVWRQVGVQTTTKTEYVDFNLGVFNGADQPNNTGDNNDYKDFLVRADIKPPLEQGDVVFGGYAWIGMSLPTYYDAGTLTTTTYPEESLQRNRFGGFAKVDYKASEDITARFRGEFLMASTEALTAAEIDSVQGTDAQAFFVHLGVQPHPRFELLARYDFYDPNTDVEKDDESWLTGGVNYYLSKGNAMVYLNYIHKMEGGGDVDNDLVLAQVQIAF